MREGEGDRESAGTRMRECKSRREKERIRDEERER